MGRVSTFDGIKNKHDTYRDEDCMEKFCESLRNQAMKVINFETKKIIRTTEMVRKHKNLLQLQNKFKHKYTNDKNNCTVKDHCDYTNENRGVVHRICNLKYSIPKEIPVVFTMDKTIIKTYSKRV